MQLTIDIPEPLYSALESRARNHQTSVQQVVLDSASQLVDGPSSRYERLMDTDSNELEVRNGKGLFLEGGLVVWDSGTPMSEEESFDLVGKAREERVQSLLARIMNPGE